jgi:LPS sulfotransferase NodH
MTEKQQLFDCISDDYKSLHGVRPRPTREFTLSELREWSAELRHRIDASIEREQREQAEHEAAVREAMTPTPEFTLGELL